jgi:hypothetical protein
MSIVFTTRLTEADWDDTLRGWRCPPLGVPGAVVEALYVDGDRVDSVKYEVLTQNTLIRWTQPVQPQRATASVKLTEELTLGAETDRWKKLAIVFPVIGVLGGALITGTFNYFSRPDDHSKTIAAGQLESPHVTTSTSPATPSPNSTAANISAAAIPPAPTTINDSVTRAKQLSLGQTEECRALPDFRWYKFRPDQPSVSVHILIRNVNVKDFITARVLDADERMIKQYHTSFGENIVIELGQAKADWYYLGLNNNGNQSFVACQIVFTERPSNTD